MPINPKLKAHLEGMTMDDAYRTKMIAVLEDAPPDVQNLWMAQNDYTKQVNEFKTHQTEWKTKADEFYTKSNAAIEGYKTETQTAKDAMEQAKARIAELEAAGGGGGGGLPRVPDEAITKEIAGLKTLLTGLESKLGNVVTKEALDQVYQQAVGFIGEQMVDLNEIAAEHQERFGKRFTKADQSELVDYANKKATELKHSVSLSEAYNMKFGDELEKQKVAKIEKEVEERLRTKNMIPGGGDGPAGGAPIERGPAQIRLEQENNRRNGVTDASKIGYSDWREAASAGANELVAEGKT